MKTSINSYTLLEILIVISIIILFLGTSLAVYNPFIQQKKLEKEVSYLEDVLNLAKGKSVASDINFTCPPSEEFGGYRVEINAANYNFKQCCRYINSKVINSCGDNIQTYNFPSSINKISGPSIIDFYPLSGGATNTPLLRVKNNSIDKCLDISITVTGIITSGTIPFPC